MNSVLVNNPALDRYFVDQDLREWCDGWWMKFRFGDVLVLILNEYQYFTEMWVWHMGSLKFIEYVNYADVMDILNLLAQEVEKVPSLEYPLVVEGVCDE